MIPELTERDLVHEICLHSLHNQPNKIKADHKVNIVDFLVVFEELNVENVCNEAINENNHHVERQQETVSAHVAALFTDEAFGALG